MWNNYNSLATPPSTNDSIHLHNTSAVKHPTKHLSDIAHPYSAPTLSLLPFPKPRAAEKEERQWTWRPQRFSNSAREDYRRAGSDGSLKLRHWAKVPKRAPGEDEEMTPNDANSSEGEDDGPYPFAKYTPDNPIIQSYTEEEYIKFLEDSAESGWTKSETDYLFSLLKEYSGRFYIVLDRYEYAGTEEQPSAKRKIEDLKARYYSVVRKLIRARAGDDPEQIKAGESLILQYGFDYVGEKARREHISSLWDRTPQQIAEETLLYTELLRLSQTSTKFTAERHALLRLLAGIESGLPDVTTRDGRLEPLNQDPQIRGVKGGLWGNVLGGPTSAAPISTAQARKKRGTGAHAQSVDWTESPTMIALNSAGATGQRQQLPPAQQAEFDTKHHIYRAPVGSALINPKNTHTAVYARSSKFPVPKPILASHLQAYSAAAASGSSDDKETPETIFSQLDVHPTKLYMPTKENVEWIERVFGAATQLIEVQKQLERIEGEVTKERARLGANAPPPGTVALPGENVDVAMGAPAKSGGESAMADAATVAGGAGNKNEDGAGGGGGEGDVTMDATNDGGSADAADDDDADDDYEEDGDADGDGDGEVRKGDVKGGEDDDDDDDGEADGDGDSDGDGDGDGDGDRDDDDEDEEGDEDEDGDGDEEDGMEGVETAAVAVAAAAATAAATAQADKTRSNAGRRTVSVASSADTTSTSNKRTRA